MYLRPSGYWVLRMVTTFGILQYRKLEKRFEPTAEYRILHDFFQPTIIEDRQF